MNNLRKSLRHLQMFQIEEDDEASNADTDDRDSGFCDDSFTDERLDIIEKMVQRNHEELIQVH